MTLANTILTGLAAGQATLPALAPRAHPVSRYIAARRLESEGRIARVGSIRTKAMRGGLPRIMWRLIA